MWRVAGRRALVLCLLTTVIPVVNPAAAEAAAKPVVYLTFDDGPGADTPNFLDLLGRYGIEGTFFVTGRAVTANPQTARRIVNEGHAIANHTWNHPSLTGLSDAAIRSELTSTTDVIRATTGEVPVCYRPPYGATNARVHEQAVAVGLPNAQWKTARSGSHWGLWDIDTNDWRLSLRSSSWSEADMMRELNKARDGDTILLHDGFSNRHRGLGVLTRWLEANHDRFEFRTLPGCGGRLIEPGFDPAEPQGWHRFQIARLYSAYFDRRPDPAGWEYWTRRYLAGVSMVDISRSFSVSSEFNRTGTLSDQEFVTFLYREVLDREPDAAGHAYWLGRLAAGTDRGQLVLFFSESPEFISRTAPKLTGDCSRATIEASYRCWAVRLPVYD